MEQIKNLSYTTHCEQVAGYGLRGVSRNLQLVMSRYSGTQSSMMISKSALVSDVNPPSSRIHCPALSDTLTPDGTVPTKTTLFCPCFWLRR